MSAPSPANSTASNVYANHAAARQAVAVAGAGARGGGGGGGGGGAGAGDDDDDFWGSTSKAIAASLAGV